MEILNNYSGLISLVAAIAAIGAVIVPIVIFRKQRKYDEEAERRSIEREHQAEQRHKQEIRQDAQDRLNAKRYANKDHFAKLAGVAKELEETTYLEMKSNRR